MEITINSRRSASSLFFCWLPPFIVWSAFIILHFTHQAYTVQLSTYLVIESEFEAGTTAESDWELVPLPAPGARTIAQISPVGKSLLDVLLRAEFAVSLRPDGLAKTGLMYVDQYRFSLAFDPKKKQIRLHSDAEDSLSQQLGIDNFKEVMQQLRVLLDKYVTQNLEGYTQTVAQNQGMQVDVVLRADLACPVTSNRREGGLGTETKTFVLLASLDPQMHYGNEVIKLTRIEWRAIGSIPMARGTEAYKRTLRTARNWEKQIDPAAAINRATDLGPSTVNPPNLPMPSDYEITYLLFEPRCKQSDVLGQARSFKHCVVLPVEPTRLYPPERFKLHCSNTYPAGTQVFYIKTYPNPDTNSEDPLLLWQYCEKGRGWKEAIALGEPKDKEKWADCLTKIGEDTLAW